MWGTIILPNESVVIKFVSTRIKVYDVNKKMWTSENTTTLQNYNQIQNGF